jgi:RHS repeat-associated protein
MTGILRCLASMRRNIALRVLTPLLRAASDDFTGKERDSKSGLDYFGARNYASRYARFLTPDWASGPAPVPYADLTDPQTLNLYAYVRNNPLSHADKDGHCWPVCTAAAGFVAGAIAGAIAGAFTEYVVETVVNGEKPDIGRIQHAALGGAITGLITGFAGPEAAAGYAALGGVAGGIYQRTLDGKEGLGANAALTDAVSSLTGAKIDSAAERAIVSTTVRKATTTTMGVIKDTIVQGSDQRGQPVTSQPAPSQLPQQLIPLPPPDEFRRGHQ